MLSNHLQCLLKATDSIADTHDSILSAAWGILCSRFVQRLYCPGDFLLQSLQRPQLFNIFIFHEMFLPELLCSGEHTEMFTAEPSSSLQWHSMSRPAPNKEEEMSRIQVTINASATGCSSLLPLTNSEWSQLRALLQDRAGVRCSRLAVMWSVFMSGRSDRWSLSVVLKAVHTVTSQSSGAAHIQQWSALITLINTLDTTAVFSEANHKQINYF